MIRWIIGIAIISLIGCKVIKPISPSIEELTISENFNNYSFSSLEGSPIYTIRISIHVIQDSTGYGNFTIRDSIGNHLPEWYWLNGLVDDASKRMSDLHPMQIPSQSPHIKDSRIRYKVVHIYEWHDQSLFNLSQNTPSTGNRMYRYIMNQDEVTHKENSLHIFVAGSPNKDNSRITSRGIASGAPDKRWTVLWNYFSLYKTSDNFWPATLLSHEIGHNLGLSHTWNRNDGCDDTPKKSKQCWGLNEPLSKECDEISECSNNIMDYNVWQNALTECQLAQIHHNINQNKGNLQDIIYGDTDNNKINCKEIGSPKTIINTGIVNLECTDGRPVKWYITPREAVLESIGTGSVASLKVRPGYNGKAVITFRKALFDSAYIEISEKLKLRTDQE